LVMEYPDSVTSISDIALAYRNQGYWAELQALEVWVLDMRRMRAPGERHPDMILSLVLTYRQEGQYLKAEVLELEQLMANTSIR
ncbi:hypothetical protein V8E51_009650, partial [Hyaloscypha variabilis]